MQYLLGIMMFLTALFLILLVLVQRGRGGGLAGAFGGAGGQSAFGTKAGDMFTKITIGTAFFWILIAAVSVRFLNQPKSSIFDDGGPLQSQISGDRSATEGDGAAAGDLNAGSDAGLLGDALEDSGLLGGTGTDAAGAEGTTTDEPAAGADTDPGSDTPPADTPPADTPPADTPESTGAAPATGTDPKPAAETTPDPDAAPEKESAPAAAPDAATPPAADAAADGPAADAPAADPPAPEKGSAGDPAPPGE